MHPTDVALLLGAGLAAGTVNAVAGGGSLVTFPALLAVGLPAKPANFTNSVAVSPGYLASVYGSRRDLPPGRDAASTLPTAAIGSVAGCLLLIVTPPTAFQLIVPFLVLGAALVLAFQERLRQVVGHPHQMSGRRRVVALHTMVGLGAVYGGYFGAALGVMLVACLGLVLDERLNRINARKNLISAVVGLVTVAVFAVIGTVDWVAVAVLAPATLTGGYLGARLARRLPAPVLRALIVGFGLVVGIYLLVRALTR
jgi:uncharacterized membrane protein YfcA